MMECGGHLPNFARGAIPNSGLRECYTTAWTWKGGYSLPREYGTHDLQEYSLNTPPVIPREIHSLIVGAVDFPYEPAVEHVLGCTGHGLWFRCEGAWIWDPYGSLVRSVLMTVHRIKSIRDIYVVTHSDVAQNASSFSRRTMLGTGFSPHVVRTVRYLLQYVYAVDPTRWMDSASKPEEAVVRTVRLFREHPLMPQTVNVRGFLLNGKDSRLFSVEA